MTNGEGVIVAVAVLGGLGFFVGLWVLIIKILSALGWSKYANRHAATGDPPPSAERLRGQSLEFGSGMAPVRYKNAVNAWIDMGGVYLRPLAVFRMFHPMLYLRWTEIEVLEQTTGWFSRVRIKVSDDLPVIGAYGRLGEIFAQKGRHASSADPMRQGY